MTAGPARTWTTGATLRAPADLRAVPALDLGSAFQAVGAAIAEMQRNANAVAELVTRQMNQAREGVLAVWRSVPRATRRYRRRRTSSDMRRADWPGTEAVTPDHPARVIHRHALRQSLAPEGHNAHRLYRKALTLCEAADERALSGTPTTSSAVSLTDLADAMHTDDTHPPGATHEVALPPVPRILSAVTSSRNEPAEGARLTHSPYMNAVRSRTKP